MYLDFSRLFQHSSKDLLGGGTVRIPADEKEWPEEWTTVHYKEYPRFPTIPLEDAPPAADFFDLVRRRTSRRDFSRTPADKRALSTLLKYSCGITQEFGDRNPRRAHPSGGARFPLEVYPVVFSGSNGLPQGLYHYNVRKHGLDVLWQRSFSEEDIGQLFTYEWVRDASFALVITAVFGRTQVKYGERGYRYILLEAGHIGQNLYLASGALGLKCCALGGTFDNELEKLIDIDGNTESVVYALALG
ncbi:MAG: SagB/ThcOx family dehydrogenase [Patescibacteria group bacterium]|nr:SagB/ThcOx family dehydrogenase [Patescibacteria group bacterium]